MNLFRLEVILLYLLSTSRLGAVELYIALPSVLIVVSLSSLHKVFHITRLTYQCIVVRPVLFPDWSELAMIIF